MTHSYGNWHTIYYRVIYIPDPRISMLYAYIWKQYNVYSYNINSSLDCTDYPQPPITEFVIKAVWSKVFIVSLHCTSFVGLPMDGLAAPNWFSALLICAYFVCKVCIPHMTHSFRCCPTFRNAMTKLEWTHGQMVKYMQQLPKHTPNCVCLAPLGGTSMEAYMGRLKLLLSYMLDASIYKLMLREYTISYRLVTPLIHNWSNIPT